MELYHVVPQHMRNAELQLLFLNGKLINVFNATNGLNGFTMGVGLLLKRVHIRYATGFYQRNTFHQFSINLDRSGKALGL